MLGYSMTPMVRYLLIINAAVFLLAMFTDYFSVLDFMALRYFSGSEFKIHQVITHMFMHASFMHLLGNMFGLFMFGPALERIWGTQRFVLFYFVCGIGAALLYTGVHAIEYRQIREKIDTYRESSDPYEYEVIIFRNFETFSAHNPYPFYELPRLLQQNPKDKELIRESFSYLEQLYAAKQNTPMIGASGAIFGILLGFGMLFPNTIIMLLFPPIPMKAKYFVLIFGGLELYLGIQNSQGDTVAHFAHVGGMLFGYLLIIYWRRRRDRFY
jgi:membrane associated rhomboid family serine protease